MIYFEPQAGLCNRMRAIESAYQLAKDIHTELCIVWLCNVDCNASFDELFERIPDVQVITFPSILGQRTTVRYHKLKIKPIMKKCDKVIKYEEMQDAAEVRAFAKDNDVYIQSWATWYPYDKGCNPFKPQKKIAKYIKEMQIELGKKCVGVHIRRTDHVQATKYSRTEAFVREMNHVLKETPESIFFLASDNDEEKQEMKRLFGTKVVINNDIELKRTSLEGMKNAVKDLFLLASCTMVLGSSGSSFSEMAAELGNIECRYVE